MPDYKCPICGEPAREGNLIPDKTDNLIHRVECPRCGFFFVDRMVDVCLPSERSDRQRAVASSIVRESWQNTTLTKEDCERFFAAKDITVPEKLDKTLIYLEKMSETVGERIEIDWNNHPEMMSITWAKGLSEVAGLVRLLGERKLIAPIEGSFTRVTITADGWQRLADLRLATTTSSQGFIAMAFHDDMKNAYTKAIAPAIKSAGYDPFRVDQNEHANKIDDEIILQIRRSKFVVADATLHRGGVYYEAGFAHGLGLPVFWSCRDTDFDDLHFDIRQYNCIKWSDSDLKSYKNALAKRIESVLGRGPKALG